MGSETLRSGDNAGAAPQYVASAADAQQIAWIPRSHRLAFLSGRDGTTQVVSYDVQSKEVRVHTTASDPITQFEYSPDGRDLAYASSPGHATELLHDRLWNGHRGVVTDTDTLYLDDFVTPGGGLAFSGAISTLWVAQQGGEAKRIKVPGNPTAFGRVFSWSTDGRYLSVSYERDDLPRNDKLYAQTSIGVVEPATGVFREVARARGPSAGAAAVKYSGGQWVDGKRIIIRREKDEHIWVSPALLEWTVVDAALGRGIEHSSWWQGPPNGWTSTNVWPVDSSSILAESTDRGVKTLLRVSASGSSYSQLIEGVGGSSSRFSFSADGSLAFINESLSRAPEVYFRDKQGHVRRLTNMNAGVQQHVRFTEREVHWRSLDGAPVSGWLLLPKEAKNGHALPLITHVKGGPGYVFPNAFADYFDRWPFPFEAMVDRGFAVFIPNYRGTSAFGPTHHLPAAIDKEPVDDVITGVRHLVENGIADPNRLGISGHSHGAWLGPLITAKHKQVFRAASFAEGAGNYVLLYELMPSRGNRELNDVVIDTGRSVNLYDHPLRFLDLSPSLQFRDVSTAMLIEAGIESQALLMLPVAKAARRFNMPHEFVIYPRTGHCILIPALMKESAEKNLDWFEFWLLGKQSSDPDKTEQYFRWRKLGPKATGES